MRGGKHRASGHASEGKEGKAELAVWLLDANVVIYLLAGDARYSERLKGLIRRGLMPHRRRPRRA